MPSSVTPVVVLHDHGWVFNQLSTEESVSVIEVHPDQLTRVEQPVVVVRQPHDVGLITRQISNVLTGTIGELSTPNTEPAVVGEGEADHTDTRETHSFIGHLANHLEPALKPRQVIRLTGDEPCQRLVFVRGVVAVAHFQAKCGVLEGAEQLTELVTQEQTQRSPPCSR